MTQQHDGKISIDVSTLRRLAKAVELALAGQRDAFEVLTKIADGKGKRWTPAEWERLRMEASATVKTTKEVMADVWPVLEFYKTAGDHEGNRQ